MGYRVLPVNPRGGRILGIDAFRSLGDLAATHPDPVDLVDVFRPARDCVAVAEAAVRIGARALWLQQGIVSPAARALAEAAGMDYVEDRCLAVDVALALRTGSIPPLPSAEDAP